MHQYSHTKINGAGRHYFSVTVVGSLYTPRFLKNLKLVAVDELHYYSGLFGRFVPSDCHEYDFPTLCIPSNVAQVIRRFRRICAAVGSKTFIPIPMRTIYLMRRLASRQTFLVCIM
jgi:hypothetical protein